MSYGGFGEQNNNLSADPQDVQRENEALQKVVAHTSDHLVDIFAMVPQNPQRTLPTPAFAGHDARILQYQDVLAKISKADSLDTPDGNALDDPEDWLSDHDDEEALRSVRVVTPSSTRLQGGFADIEGKDA